jgi:hypothetical protein
MAMRVMSLMEGVKLFMFSSPLDMTPELAESEMLMLVDSAINSAAGKD